LVRRGDPDIQVAEIQSVVQPHVKVGSSIPLSGSVVELYQPITRISTGSSTDYAEGIKRLMTQIFDAEDEIHRLESAFGVQQHTDIIGTSVEFRVGSRTVESNCRYFVIGYADVREHCERGHLIGRDSNTLATSVYHCQIPLNDLKLAGSLDCACDEEHL
jgi:hypothetical protein